MSITTRLLLATAFVAVLFVMSIRGRLPAIESPARGLDAIPAHLGAWSVDKGDPDPKLSARFGASQVVDRIYQNAAGCTISAYVAVFEDYFDGSAVIVPHSPETCYPANGYRIVSEKELDVPSETGPGASATLLSLERDGGPVYVLFWYKMGDRSFSTTKGMRSAIWAKRGEGSWPPVVKVMLQISKDDPRAAETHLMELAKPLATWLDDYR